ncbi:MAG: GTP-binding protein [Escherichia sp.]
MNRIPVIIINGFLGAGKTTLMKTCSHRQTGIT